MFWQLLKTKKNVVYVTSPTTCSIITFSTISRVITSSKTFSVITSPTTFSVIISQKPDGVIVKPYVIGEGNVMYYMLMM